MSRKSRRNRPPEAQRESPAPSQPAPPAAGIGRGTLFVGTAIALLLAFVIGTLLYTSGKSQSGQAAAAGLDLERVRSDMHGEAVSRRVAQDAADARALNVTKTPEYFVNGRPLPSFGWDPLLGLVRAELRAAYP